jgi:hypothetical protein
MFSLRQYEEPTESDVSSSIDTTNTGGTQITTTVLLTEVSPCLPQETQSTCFWVSFVAEHPGVWDKRYAQFLLR